MKDYRRRGRLTVMRLAGICLAVGWPSALVAADLVLHPAGLDRAQVVQLKVGKMARMHVASVDDQAPAELGKARKLLLAPGAHRLTLKGTKVVITGMSFTMGPGGGVSSASVQGEQREAEVTLRFEATAGQKYALTCDTEATCEVRDGDKKVVSAEPKAEGEAQPAASESPAKPE